MAQLQMPFLSKEKIVDAFVRSDAMGTPSMCPATCCENEAVKVGNLMLRSRAGVCVSLLLSYH